MATHWCRRWLKSLFTTTQPSAAKRRRSNKRLSLRVEALEDRTLPTTFFTVTTLADSGAGSLRSEITLANQERAANPSEDIAVNFAVTGTITLQSSLPALETMAIAGPGANQLTIQHDPSHPTNYYNLLNVTDAAATVNISGLTFANGAYNAPGSILKNSGGTVHLSNCTFTASNTPVYNYGGVMTIDNTSFVGNTINSSYAPEGAIYNDYSLAHGGATLTINNSSFVNNGIVQGFNQTYGGAIANHASTLNVNSCDFESNNATDGGAIDNQGTATITASTFHNNTASDSFYLPYGGAIYNDWGCSLGLVDCTLAGNSAYDGGAIWDYGNSPGVYLTIADCTIAGNSAQHVGGGIRAASVQLHDTIVATNTAPTAPDVSGTISSLGHSLIGITNGSSGWTGTDLTGTAALPLNPLRGPVQNNGGPTPTMALLPGSPAFNAGNNALAPGLYDQRGAGFNRISGGTMDIGAYEVQATVNQPPTVVTPAASSSSPVTGTTTTLSVLGGDDGGEANLTYTWAVTGLPTEAAAPTFSANGSNAAKNTTATFFKASVYTFQVTIVDGGGLSVTSQVTVTVAQTLTSITVLPGGLSVPDNVTQQFSAIALDQFGAPLVSQSSVVWSLAGGIGSLSAGGLYAAPASGNGSATIRATIGSVSGTTTVTVADHLHTALTTFLPGVYLPNPSSQTGPVTADLNGDGRPDVVTVSPSSNTVGVTLNNGAGGFQATVQYSTGSLVPAQAVVADFNGDGKADLVALCMDPVNYHGHLLYFQGNGDGTFRAPVDWGDIGVMGTRDSSNNLVYYVISPLRVGDFTNDGRPDLVVLLQNITVPSTTMLVLLNTGSAFQLRSIPLAQSAFDVMVGDFNNDGKQDLVLASGTTIAPGNILLYRGNGDGTFQAPVATPIRTPWTVVGTGDFNGDGKLDVLVQGGDENGVLRWLYVYQGNGDGTFVQTARYDLAAAPYPAFTVGYQTARVADFNGDGKLDILYEGEQDGGSSLVNVGVLLGNGDGTFQAPAPLSLLHQLVKGNDDWVLGTNLTVGDFNGDGLPDLFLTVRDRSDSIQKFVQWTNNPVSTGLANPGFELPGMNGIDPPNSLETQFCPPGVIYAATDWVISGLAGTAVSGAQVTNTLPNIPTAPQGTQVAFLQAYNGVGQESISQTHWFDAGSYSVTFSAALWGSSDHVDLQVLIDEVVVGTFRLTSTGFSDFTANFTVTQGAHTLKFNDASASSSGILLDNVRLTPVGAPTLSPDKLLQDFSGVNFFQTPGYTPPDTNAAVGPTAVVETVNTEIVFLDKTTGNPLPGGAVQDFSTFFASVHQASAPYFSDPYVLYDDVAQRFYVGAIEFSDESGGGTLVENFDLAVSNSSDPTAGWKFFQVSTVTEGGTSFADFPKMGFNHDGVFVSFNQFDDDGSGHDLILSISKNALLTKTSLTQNVDYFQTDVDTATGRIAPNGQDEFDHRILIPVRMEGSSAGDAMWFVQRDTDSNTPGEGTAAVNLIKMTGFLSNNPTFTTYHFTVNPFNDSPGDPNLTMQLDDRILSADMRNGKLVAAGNIGLPGTTKNVSRWYEFDVSGTPTLLQQGDINPGPGVYTSYPSIAINANGDIGITYIQDGAGQSPSMYITGRLAGDAPNTLHPGILTAKGLVGALSSYPGRGGDYSSVWVDPTDGTTFWAANEYAYKSLSFSTDIWGTAISQFSVLPVDQTPPDTTITAQPASITNSTTATFTFTGSDNVTPAVNLTFLVSLDGSAFVVAPSPVTYTALSQGSHTFRVEARDQAGNIDPTPASFTWTVDTTPPAATITAKPALFSNSTTATFTFTGADNVTPAGSLTFLVSLDGSAYAASTSPKTYSGVSAGSHTFRVEAVDQAGNVSAAVSYTWTIDLVAPTATITAKPAAFTSSTTASFSFTGADNVTPAGSLTFLVSLDGSAYAASTSPKTYSGLSAGSHTFKVEAVDQAGNIGAPAAYTWIIDRTAPQVSITATPPIATGSTTATFTFTGADNVTPTGSLVFQVSLDGGAWAAATSPKTFASLTQGSHTFQVRDLDQAGNVSAAASYVWTVTSTQPGYTVTDLGTLGGSASYARAVNAAGQVAGYATTATGQTHAFIWNSGVMTDLGTLGGSTSFAMGINSAGQVVGYSTRSTGQTHAFIWSGGVMTDLGTLGGSASYATGINDAGQVVGYSTTAGGPFHAFVWSGGVMTDLGTLGGSASYAMGINNSGQIAGYSLTAGGQYHAFRYSAGAMTDLGTLGGTASYGYAINASGQVAGYATTASGQNHAFLSNGSALTDLGTLGGTASYGYAVNTAGQVAGYSTNPTGAARPVLVSGGARYDLTTLVPVGSTLTPTYAYGINDAGQVIGYGLTSGGQTHAMLLTPNSAAFVSTDTATQGSWKVRYGANGYSIFQDSTSYPSYAAVSLLGASNYTWSGSTADGRALQKGAAGSTDRIAAAVYSSSSFTIDVSFNDNRAHQVSVYALDWDSQGRSERIDIIDPVTHAVLSTQTVSSFSAGVYLTWSLRGHVQIQVTNLAGPNAVLSGVFFNS